MTHNEDHVLLQVRTYGDSRQDGLLGLSYYHAA